MLVSEPMRKRAKLKDSTETVEKADLYGLREPTVGTLSTGCTLLDCVLGGGWGLSRVSNIVGDRSSGKTLLAIEACANFARQFPDGKIVYAESEAAFDKSYAENLGLPVDRVEFPDSIDTIEDFFTDLNGRLDTDKPTLYILDSLDALSSRAELEREIDDKSFGGEKPKKLGELFRRLVRKLKKSNVTLLVISQLRDKIGVAFGESQTRTGGRALDFYASHIVWLAHIQKLHKTKKGVKRTTGVLIKANCKKNKIASPFRECEFPIVFEYGVEDVVAGLTWLIEVKRTDALGIEESDAEKILAGLEKLTPDAYADQRQQVTKAVKDVWAEIEQSFRPKRKKYTSV